MVVLRMSRNPSDRDGEKYFSSQEKQQMQKLRDIKLSGTLGCFSIKDYLEWIRYKQEAWGWSMVMVSILEAIEDEDGEVVRD